MIKIYIALCLIINVIVIFPQSKSPVAPQIEIGIPINSQYNINNKISKITKSIYGIHYGEIELSPNEFFVFWINEDGLIYKMSCANDTSRTLTYNYDKYNNIVSSVPTNKMSTCILDYLILALGYGVYGKRTYQYDEKQNIIESKIFDSQNKLIGKSSFEYIDNNIIETIITSMSTEEKRTIRRIENGLIADVEYCKNENDCSVERYEYEIEAGLVKSQKKITEFPNRKPIIETEWIKLYTYDVDNKIVEISKYDYEFNLIDRYVYEYGNYGEIISVKKFGKSNNPIEFTKYKYE